MRIRSTKPEFWRSRRIASVDWDSWDAEGRAAEVEPAERADDHRSPLRGPQV